ncbi:CoA transferase [Streptomyces fildesensis]|uniref:CoA transferase n=1 Tax=Streptomyces fildesensis TaxID=375757 RepID=A0ABW8C6H5_9ACTN
MTQGIDAATAHAWAALDGPAELVEGVSYIASSGVLPSRLPVRELARATVGVCSLAAAELFARRSGGSVPEVRVDEGAVATAFVSERHLRIDGRKPTSFAPLSGFWRAADGWVRTHANYPHHRARLLTALEIPDEGDEGDDGAPARQLADRLLSRPALEVQETVHAAGGLAVAVGASHRAELPLVESRRIGDGAAGTLSAAALPAAGVRVLDLTRVIAGPVATRTLALLGADVLRVDSPRLPEHPDAHADTGFGKRSTLLDLDVAKDRLLFEELLSSADVVITGYRPGALDRHGLTPRDLLERRPGLVVAQLCAWGWEGPWAGRRGFDSLVQAACGIAGIEAAPDGHPGVLPAQALDHGTGYLLAAAVLRALTDRQDTGGGRHLRFSLAGTASWLTHGIRPAATDGETAYDPGSWLAETPSPYGRLQYVRPPVHYVGGPDDWTRPPTLWGTDSPGWI